MPSFAVLRRFSVAATGVGTACAATAVTAPLALELLVEPINQVGCRPDDKDGHADVNNILHFSPKNQRSDLIDQEGANIRRPDLPGDGGQSPLGGVHLLADGGHRRHAGDVEQHEHQEGQKGTGKARPPLKNKQHQNKPPSLV